MYFCIPLARTPSILPVLFPVALDEVATYMNESYSKEYAKLCFSFFTKRIFFVSD